VSVRFGAYGDIHHASKASRCLDLKDTLEIEKQFHARAAAQRWDFTVFVGDRYLKREPEDEVKVRADRCLAECLAMRPNMPHYHLVGNHDWTKNNRAWHTSESLRGFKNLIVIDAPYSDPDMLEPWAVHALPADVPFEKERYRVFPDKFNLFLFHGIVKGSLMSDSSDRVFDEGIDISVLDSSDWQFVIGGDIHVPQIIPFNYTKGGYTGAILQRDRSDADKPRGWLEVKAEKSISHWVVQTEFTPTRNFFHKESHNVGPTTRYDDLDIQESYIYDQAVDIKLIGSREDVDRVASDPKWGNLETFMGARSLNVIREYKVAQLESVVDFSQSRDVQDDLETYLKSGFSVTGDLSQDKIFEMVEKLRKG
jgi:DNA repair exonuclease SbcCD nuclease subunit